MKTAIVTDSTCDIPAELAEQMGIQVVPTILVIGEKNFEDGKGFTREEFYRKLPEMDTLPTTAAPSIGTIQEVYENVLQQGYQNIISIHISSKLSGVFNAASAAAQAFENRIHLVDSQQVSMGLGFQAIAAAEAAKSGQPVDAILDAIAGTLRRTRLIAMLDTLEYIRRSGRLSLTRAAIGTLLDLKPFLEIKDGLVFSIGHARTRRKGLQRLTQHLQDLGGLERLALVHSNAEQDARSLLEEITNKPKMMPIFVNITTIIGTHVGPKAIGFVSVLN